MIFTALAFIVTLGILIVVHEYAHYRVAVACGVKVDRFSVGFGRVLWRRRPQPGGTEFVVSALPLGGYVRWIDDREHPPLSPQDKPFTFASKPLWQRAAIVAAGPVSNLLLAVLLFAAVHWIGVEEPRALLAQPAAGSLAEQAGLQARDLVTEVGIREAGETDPAWSDVRSLSDLRWSLMQAALKGDTVSLRVRAAGGHAERTVTLDLSHVDMHDADTALARQVGVALPYYDPVIGRVEAGPARAAGLQPGDRVLSLDGVPVPDGQSLFERIRKGVQGDVAPPQRWTVERQGRTLDVVVQPRVVGEGSQKVARIDAVVARPAEVTEVRYGLVEGFVKGARRTWEVSAMSLKMLGRMVAGQASLKNLSGPLTIAEVAGHAARQGPAYYLGMLALVSVSLGVLNLLPLPLLDGGHLMYYIFEAVTGRPVAGQWLRWLQGGGALIMLLLMSLALYNDLARLLGLH